MGMPVKFGYWISQFLDYRRSRLPWTRYLPLSFFVVLSSLASAESREKMSLGWTIPLYLWILALSLIAQFRLWDDLADLKADRGNYPERVLCRVESSAPFGMAVIVLAALNISGLVAVEALLAIKTSPGYLIATPWQTPSMLALLMLWYTAWYACRGKYSQHAPPPLFRSLANLIKYPAFVIILAAHLFTSGARLTLAAAMVFLVFCAYELLHDHRLAALGGACRLMQGVFLALSIIAICSFRLAGAWQSKTALIVLALVALCCFVRFGNKEGGFDSFFPRALKRGKWIFVWGLLFDISLVF
jgi:hypothetical protein